MNGGMNPSHTLTHTYFPVFIYGMVTGYRTSGGWTGALCLRLPDQPEDRDPNSEIQNPRSVFHTYTSAYLP